MAEAVPPSDAPAAASAAPAAGPSLSEARPLWRSEQLFGPLREISIQHGDAIYRLRQTALGKLILTK
jgi:hemin uptake protein HemP